jgi:hypothetical protein
MKKLFLFLFISCSFLVQPTNLSANGIAKTVVEEPTILVGTFYHYGGEGLYPGYYQVFSKETDISQVLYITDTSTSISYDVPFSTYSETTNTASIFITTPYGSGHFTTYLF